MNVQKKIYSKVDDFKVVVCKVDFIHLANRMSGKKTNRKALSLDEQQRLYKKIGNHIRQRRRDLGYTAALDFAYENDLPPAQYARYEGGSNMKIGSLLKVLHALEISPAEFFKDFK